MTGARQQDLALGARAEKTTERILDATAELLLEAGFAGLNTNAVAQRAGVNISTLYSHFSDKYELLEGLAVRMRLLAITTIAKEIDDTFDRTERLNILVNRGMQARIDQPWMVALEEAMMASPKMRATWSRQKIERAAQLMDILDLRPPGVPQEQMLMVLALAYEIAIATFRLGLSVDEGRRELLLRELKLNLNDYLGHYR
jgi:AcrR family transcriptional regulator